MTASKLFKVRFEPCSRLGCSYIVLLAICVLAYVLWRRGGAVLAITSALVGIPLWFGMGIRATLLDDRHCDRNRSAPQRSRRPR